jgi:hypothetical protein
MAGSRADMSEHRSRGVRDVARAVIGHPGLWVPAIKAMFRLARPGWWRRWPPLPLPTEELWRLRMTTNYGGDGSAEPEAGDVRSYLDWASRSRVWRQR